jgi:hypothetical protein
VSPNSIIWVGMDAHKNSIKVAALIPEQAARVVPYHWTTATRVVRRFSPWTRRTQ